MDLDLDLLIDAHTTHTRLPFFLSLSLSLSLSPFFLLPGNFAAHRNPRRIFLSWTNLWTYINISMHELNY